MTIATIENPAGTAPTTTTETYNVTIPTNDLGLSGLSLHVVAGPNYTDTAAIDTFNQELGVLVGSDPNTGTTLTYGIVGGSTDQSLFGYDTSLTGTYGTLYVNSATGAYTFVPNADAINALSADTNEAFTLTVSDGTNTVAQPFEVTIYGVDDAPSFASIAGPTYNDTSGNDTFSPQTGMLSGSDPDTGDTLTYGISGGTSGGGTTIAGVTYDIAKTGSFGTLYVSSATGQYTYQENDGRDQRGEHDAD